MFKIATILRNKQTPNIFRRTLLNAFSEGIGNEYLLCSGFFQEKQYVKNSYYVSDSFIKNSPDFPCRVKVTTVGVYSKYIWGSQYDDFTKAISAIKCSCGKSIEVEKRKPKTSNKWHAKIFIVRSNGVPMLAIVGSSNITRNAFDEQKGWNRECDSIIWNTKSSEIDTLVRQSVSGQLGDEGETPDDLEKQHEIVISKYDGEDLLNTRNDTMDTRLNDLWDEIIAESDAF